MMKILTENNVVVSYQIVGGGYTPNKNQVVYEVDEIPEEVQNAYIEAFCYSKEKGFYENPDYVPPEKPIDETNNTILDLAEMAIDHEMRVSMLELGLIE